MCIRFLLNDNNLTLFLFSHKVCHSSILFYKFLEKFLYAPVNAGDIVGYVRFYNNGRFIKQVSLTSAEAADVSVKEKINLWDRIIGFFDRW